ncbi:MAG: spermidine synthase [Flavobacteriaceae bacterium]|nr:spermidine synthase [Flavobacteriaceae bacterium]
MSRSLEITLVNGKLVLDSQNTNYSYGSLQRVLRKGLIFIGFDKIKKMEHILVLGVAGGSVIKTITDEIEFQGKITGVEIDGEIIKIADKYFNISKIKNLEIVLQDAFEFVLETKLQYDLIIIDIFQDTVMPNFLFESFFQFRLGEILNKNGYILFNTMLLSDSDNQRNIEYIKNIDTHVFEVQTIPRIEHHNELIVIKKRLK